MRFSGLGTYSAEPVDRMLFDRFGQMGQEAEFRQVSGSLRQSAQVAMNDYQRALREIDPGLKVKREHIYAQSVRGGNGVQDLKKPEFRKLWHDLDVGRVPKLDIRDPEIGPRGFEKAEIRSPGWQWSTPADIHVPLTGSAGVPDPLKPLSEKRYFASQARHVSAFSAVSAMAIFGGIAVASGVDRLWLTGGANAAEVHAINAKYREDIADFYEKWSCIRKQGGNCSLAGQCLTP